MASDNLRSVDGKQGTAVVSNLPGDTSSTPLQREERLVSLDTFRGIIMFCIAAGGGAVITRLLALKPTVLFNAILLEFHHSIWEGLHFYDCIWPSFMLMVGISIPLSFAKRSRTQTYPQMFRHAVTRFAVIFLLGTVQGSIITGAPEWYGELSGVLQPIAIAYLVAFLLVRKRQWIQAAVGGSILATNALIMAFVPAQGVPAGSYQEMTNIVRCVDIRVLGRTYLPGNLDGVGGTVLCMWYSIPITILGMLIGEWLMSTRSKENKVKMVAGAGFFCLAAGYTLSPIVPVIFKLVTASFVLVSAGWASLMFLFMYWTIDIRGHRRWTLPFVVIGCNSIFIYMFPSFVPMDHLVSIFTKGMLGTSAHMESLLQAVVVLVVQWLMLFWMYRNKILIKV
jgi:predicted acyltransferase